MNKLFKINVILLGLLALNCSNISAGWLDDLKDLFTNGIFGNAEDMNLLGDDYFDGATDVNHFKASETSRSPLIENNRDNSEEGQNLKDASQQEDQNMAIIVHPGFGDQFYEAKSEPRFAPKVSNNWINHNVTDPEYKLYLDELYKETQRRKKARINDNSLMLALNMLAIKWKEEHTPKIEEIEEEEEDTTISDDEDLSEPETEEKSEDTDKAKSSIPSIKKSKFSKSKLAIFSLGSAVLALVLYKFLNKQNQRKKEYHRFS